MTNERVERRECGPIVTERWKTPLSEVANARSGYERVLEQRKGEFWHYQVIKTDRIGNKRQRYGESHVEGI